MSVRRKLFLVIDPKVLNPNVDNVVEMTDEGCMGVHAHMINDGGALQTGSCNQSHSPSVTSHRHDTSIHVYDSDSLPEELNEYLGGDFDPNSRLDVPPHYNMRDDPININWSGFHPPQHSTPERSPRKATWETSANLSDIPWASNTQTSSEPSTGDFSNPIYLPGLETQNISIPYGNITQTSSEPSTADFSNPKYLPSLQTQNISTPSVPTYQYIDRPIWDAVHFQPPPGQTQKVANMSQSLSGFNVTPMPWQLPADQSSGQLDESTGNSSDPNYLVGYLTQNISKLHDPYYHDLVEYDSNYGFEFAPEGKGHSTPNPRLRSVPRNNHPYKRDYHFSFGSLKDEDNSYCSIPRLRESQLYTSLTKASPQNLAFRHSRDDHSQSSLYRDNTYMDRDSHISRTSPPPHLFRGATFMEQDSNISTTTPPPHLFRGATFMEWDRNLSRESPPERLRRYV